MLGSRVTESVRRLGELGVLERRVVGPADTGEGDGGEAGLLEPRPRQEHRGATALEEKAASPRNRADPNSAGPVKQAPAKSARPRNVVRVKDTVVSKRAPVNRTGPVKSTSSTSTGPVKTASVNTTRPAQRAPVSRVIPENRVPVNVAERSTAPRRSRSCTLAPLRSRCRPDQSSRPAVLRPAVLRHEAGVQQRLRGGAGGRPGGAELRGATGRPGRAA